MKFCQIVGRVKVVGRGKNHGILVEIFHASTQKQQMAARETVHPNPGFTLLALVGWLRVISWLTSLRVGHKNIRKLKITIFFRHVISISVIFILERYFLAPVSLAWH